MLALLRFFLAVLASPFKSRSRLQPGLDLIVVGLGRYLWI